jgi:hypothetical protein
MLGICRNYSFSSLVPRSSRIFRGRVLQGEVGDARRSWDLEVCNIN